MLIEYSSNNSGGSWWLGDKDWKALEEAGWKVDWRKEKFIGALATNASKEFETPKDAILEFERVTGQTASDEGCNCCGPPHSFSWEDDDGAYDHASGEGVLEVLAGERVPTRREMMEEMIARGE